MSDETSSLKRRDVLLLGAAATIGATLVGRLAVADAHARSETGRQMSNAVRAAGGASKGRARSTPEVLREDELAIRDLAFRYARMVDRRGWSEIPRVFSPDAVFSVGGRRMKGCAEIEAGLSRIDRFSATQHCVHNQVTQLDGDQGTGEFHCVAYHIHEREGVPYKLDMGIRYEDRYVRNADGWRLAERTLHLIWQQGLPLDLSVADLAKPAL